MRPETLFMCMSELILSYLFAGKTTETTRGAERQLRRKAIDSKRRTSISPRKPPTFVKNRYFFKIGPFVCEIADSVGVLGTFRNPAEFRPRDPGNGSPPGKSLLSKKLDDALVLNLRAWLNQLRWNLRR